MSVLGIVVITMLSSFIVRNVIYSPDGASLDDDYEKYALESTVQLNILNACDVKGLAAQTKEFLRGKGFDVVEIGNAKELLDKTVVINRSTDDKNARKLAYALGLEDNCIVEAQEPEVYLHATVIIGSDYQNLSLFK
jgi:hypothetical protein